MIENEELGLKVAENDEERFWEEIKESAEKDIANLEKMLKFQNAILELALKKRDNAVTKTEKLH
jgi:hypothetical protein